MQLALLLTLIAVAILLIAVLFKLNVLAPGSRPADQFTSIVTSFGARLDAVQQGLLTSFNTALQGSAQNLATSIADAKGETRSRIDERVGAFSTEVRSAIDVFRENVESRIASARTEQQNQLAQLETRLENRFADLQGRVASDVSELQRSTKTELADGRKELSQALNTTNEALLHRFDRLQEGNEAKLTEIRQSVEAKLAENIEKNFGAFKEMADGIAQLKSTGQQIAAFSEEIGQLTDILRSPKLRGDFGEFELENMLKNVIPPEHYRMKAQINGAIADAAIFLKEGQLCIDSKFPLDNYRRAVDPETSEEEQNKAEKAFEHDVFGHITDIATKYIVPGITLDFALMFIPAESVYYQMCLNPAIQEFCRESKVLAVSPNTLFAYFQVLAIGFRGMKLQEAAKRIEEVLLRTKRDFDVFKQNFRLMGTHLQNAQNRFSDANIAAEQFSVTLDRLKFGAVDGEIIEHQAVRESTGIPGTSEILTHEAEQMVDGPADDRK